MSKLADFLTKNKIADRRILATSKDLEGLRPEDRALKLAKKTKKEGESKDGGEKKKPRSGRPVSPPALRAARAGEGVSGPTKTRILRAVNAVLASKKKPEITLRDLF